VTLVGDTTVLRTEGHDQFIAFDGAGHQIWQSPGTDVAASNSDLIIISGYAHDSTGTYSGTYCYTAYQAATGATLWSRCINANVLLSGDLLFTDGTLGALDARTGQPRWQTNIPLQLAGVGGVDPIVDSGDAVFVATDDQVTAIDRASGAIRWQVPFGEKLGALSADASRVYVGNTYHPLITALDRRSGQQVWRIQTPDTNEPNTSLFPNQGRYLFASTAASGGYETIDTTTGAVVGQLDAFGGKTFVGSRIYIADPGSGIKIVDANVGKVTGSFGCQYPLFAAAFVACPSSASGPVGIFDATTGRKRADLPNAEPDASAVNDAGTRIIEYSSSSQGSSGQLTAIDVAGAPAS
jgi:outer membrane protein assembly factor BamB